MEENKGYYAFISYKREDEKWAKWLQHKLEHYKFPTNLNGRTDLPKNIRPTFRDVTDLKPGLLAEVINNALLNSEWLIVVCSPRAAKSPWVCKEAQTFIDLGRADRIIPFVIEGNPFSEDVATECFPEALLKLTGSNELLAANINEMGRDAAAIKVIARMFNLRFDTIWQRYERELLRKRWITIISVFALAVISIVIATWIWHQNSLLKEKDWKMMKNQARAIAEKANQLIDDGDSYTAIKILLEVLPDISNSTKKPYLPEVEKAFRKAIFEDKFILAVNDLTSAYFDYSDKYILTETDDSLKIWDASNATLVGSISRYSISGRTSPEACFCPQKHYVVFPSNDSLFVWDYLNNTHKFVLGHKSYIESVNYDREGRKIVSASTDGFIKIWDAKTLSCIQTLDFYKYCSPYSFSVYFDNAGDNVVLLGSGDVMMKWNIEKGTVLLRKIKYPAVLEELPLIKVDNNIEFIYDDRSISKYSGGYTNKLKAYWGNPRIEISDTKTKKIQHTLYPHKAYIRSAYYSHDKKYIISSSGDGTVRVFPVNKKVVLNESIIDESKFAFFDLHDHPIIVTTVDNNIRLYDVSINKYIKCFKGYTDSISDNQQLFGALLSRNGRYFVSYSGDEDIVVWDCNSEQLLERLTDHYSFVYDAKFSKDGNFLVSCSRDGTVKLWDCNTWGCLRTYVGPNENAESLSQVFVDVENNRIIANSLDNSYIWELNNERYTHKFDNKRAFLLPNGDILTVPNGETWKINGTQLSQIGYSANVIPNAFSPDGTIMATSSWGELMLWNLNSEGIIAEYDKGENSTDPFSSICFSHSGRQLLSMDYDGRLYIYDFYPLDTLISLARNRFRNRQLTPEERRKYFLE